MTQLGQLRNTPMKETEACSFSLATFSGECACLLPKAATIPHNIPSEVLKPLAFCEDPSVIRETCEFYELLLDCPAADLHARLSEVADCIDCSYDVVRPTIVINEGRALVCCYLFPVGDNDEGGRLDNGSEV